MPKSRPNSPKSPGPTSRIARDTHARSQAEIAASDRPWLILGNPENRRVALFQDALHRVAGVRATEVSYLDFLRRPEALFEQLAPQTILRIESPGENAEVEKRLIAAGAEKVGSREHCESIARRGAMRLRDDRGRVRYARQWFLGFKSVLEFLEKELKKRADVLALSSPASIAVLFDKPRCQQRLVAAGVPVPESLGHIECYDQLRERMRRREVTRVFVKLASGSSSSGVVALHVHPQGVRAVTSLELTRTGGVRKLYNNLRVAAYTRERDVRAIIDTLCRERVQVERWLPKGALGGRAFDLRVVTIAGEPAHTVVRTSRSPLTNLHLGNRRGDVAELLSALGPERWQRVQATVAQAAAVFPRVHTIGWDVLLTPGFRECFILEANAFGDLLPNVQHQGKSTYEYEIESALQRLSLKCAEHR